MRSFRLIHAAILQMLLFVLTSVTGVYFWCKFREGRQFSLFTQGSQLIRDSFQLTPAR